MFFCEAWSVIIAPGLATVAEDSAHRPDYMLCATQPSLLRAGEMNDAAEVLRMLYDALIQQGHRDMVTTCFGLDIHESVRCRHCDMETHALRYTQYFQVHGRPASSSLASARDHPVMLQ